jgi:hypothetical protein
LLWILRLRRIRLGRRGRGRISLIIRLLDRSLGLLVLMPIRILLLRLLPLPRYRRLRRNRSLLLPTTWNRLRRYRLLLLLLRLLLPRRLRRTTPRRRRLLLLPMRLWRTSPRRRLGRLLLPRRRLGCTTPRRFIMLSI